MHVKNGLLKLIEVHRLTSKDMHSENCRWNLFEPNGQAQSLLFRHQGLATFPGQMRWFTRFEVSSRLQRLFTRKSLKEKTGTATLDEEGVKQRLQSAKRVARGWGAIANLKRKSICYHIQSSELQETEVKLNCMKLTVKPDMYESKWPEAILDPHSWYASIFVTGDNSLSSLTTIWNQGQYQSQRHTVGQQ